MTALETISKRNDEDKIELTVTISADEVQRYLNAAYREAGKVRIPGFRPGKAPRRVLENHYGGTQYFQVQATEELVEDRLPMAIDAEGYVPLDKPDVAKLELVEEGSDYCFSTTFTVRPLLELASYGPVQIELPSEEPTTAEIEQQIDAMLEYYVDFVEVTDRPVRDGDFLTLDMEWVGGDGRIEDLSGEGVPYQMGSGGMPVSFEGHLGGMKADETREFDIDLSPEGAASAGGAPAHVTVTVKQIRTKVRPELTDAWVKETLEFDSVDEFKERIAEPLREQKRSEVASLRERLMFEELVARLQGGPPEALVTQTEQGIYRNFFTSLQQSGQTLDSFLARTDTTPEAFRSDIKDRAVELASQELALDALARHLAFEVTDEELREEFALSGADDPDALYRQWKDNGRLSEIREGLLRTKAAQHLDESAEVHEPGSKPAAAKKAPAKKAPAKKAAAKPADGKSAEKKPAAKKKAAGKAAEKPAAKKPAAKKTTEKKPQE
ncbi:MAG: trigger factor [Coriobacteriales bacterium]|jgi:trigger factor|nr:trigger factor [Coriobacteriales bacterium]